MVAAIFLGLYYIVLPWISGMPKFTFMHKNATEDKMDKKKWKNDVKEAYFIAFAYSMVLTLTKPFYYSLSRWLVSLENFK